MAVTGDDFIKVGFWSQLGLLFLVDWGTLRAFANGGVPWYHYVGFVTVNTFLLGLTWVMWGWLRTKRSPVGRPRAPVAAAEASDPESP